MGIAGLAGAVARRYSQSAGGEAAFEDTPAVFVLA
jgi:hypothetical protein